MVAWLIIFTLALVCMAGMLVWRGRQIRQDKVPAAPHPEYPHWNLGILRQRALSYLKRHGHGAVVFSLKTWVQGEHEIKKQREKLGPLWRAKFRKLFKHHAYLEGQSRPVSKFLDSLNNYKKRLQKIRKEIKEEIKNKSPE